MFAGAGTSLELGVPMMAGLATEFMSHARQWDVEPAIVSKLMRDVLDIERLIDAVDAITSARVPLGDVGAQDVPLTKVDKVRSEVEWFIQHAAERIVPTEARLQWGATLRSSERAQLTIVTTNYDRAIELAANAEDIALDDGFEPFTSSESAEWVGFGKRGNAIRLAKLHGSTDWYADAEREAPTKLRHPMPLFGRAILRLSSGRELSSALVLPSREKLLNHAPYPRLSQVFLDAVDSCDVAFFVGTSLRDQHLRGAVRDAAVRAPTFLVNPDGSDHGIAGVKVICQCASQFLIGTFPSALHASDPTAFLEAVSESTVEPKGILGCVQTAVDTERTARDRCAALDAIDELGVALDPHLIRILLDDPDARVARYALSLIALSPLQRGLLSAAEQSRHGTDPAFLEDLDLLRTLEAARAVPRSTADT